MSSAVGVGWDARKNGVGANDVAIEVRMTGNARIHDADACIPAALLDGPRCRTADGGHRVSVQRVIGVVGSSGSLVRKSAWEGFTQMDFGQERKLQDVGARMRSCRLVTAVQPQAVRNSHFEVNLPLVAELVQLRGDIPEDLGGLGALGRDCGDFAVNCYGHREVELNHPAGSNKVKAGWTSVLFHEQVAVLRYNAGGSHWQHSSWPR